MKFNWDLFLVYDSLRVLTYSASISAIVRMLDKYSFTKFDCVFRIERILRDIKDLLVFQKVVVGDTRAAIMGLKDEQRIHVLRKHIAHEKLFLLSNPDGRRRVIIG